ncbi:MAG TPA: hypothetical protein VFK48_16570 [Usitatibacter sp.]|nr:hypothetical protein [Usitatibacter sp.]
MSTFRFPGLPGTGSVAATVTMVVSGWLFLAAAAMVTAPTDTQVARRSSVTVSPVTPVAATAEGIAPEARLTIVVEARRVHNS